jgi:acetoin utilization deacetylase AcuC-like enzyme
MANLRLTTADYGWITDVACAVAERHAKGRIVSTLEGGYDLPSLAASAATHIERLIMA